MMPARHTKSFPLSLIIISICLACYRVAKNEKNCAFVGARPNMLNMPKSASVYCPTVYHSPVNVTKSSIDQLTIPTTHPSTVNHQPHPPNAQWPRPIVLIKCTHLSPSRYTSAHTQRQRPRKVRSTNFSIVYSHCVTCVTVKATLCSSLGNHSDSLSWRSGRPLRESDAAVCDDLRSVNSLSRAELGTKGFQGFIYAVATVPSRRHRRKEITVPPRLQLQG